MSHILVAVSSPWAAEHMAAPLTRLAQRLEARVTLLHVVRGAGNPTRAVEEGQQAVQRLAAGLTAAGIACDVRVTEASEDIPGAILAAAGEAGATMIFMGITGKSPFARSASDDVPLRLVRRTPIPVLLLPPGLDLTL